MLGQPKLISPLFWERIPRPIVLGFSDLKVGASTLIFTANTDKRVILVSGKEKCSVETLKKRGVALTKPNITLK